MATTSDTWDFSPGSMEITITKAAADDADDLSIMEIAQDSTAPVPPLHVHPTQEERYEVLSGTMVVTADGTEHRLGPGESHTVPPGVPHTYRVGGDELRFVTRHRPGSRFETYMEEIWRLATVGGVTGPDSASAMLRFATVIDAFPDVLVVASRGQRIAMKALALVGRALGYPSSYR